MAALACHTSTENEWMDSSHSVCVYQLRANVCLCLPSEMRNNDEGASLGGNKRQGDKSAEMNAEKIQQRAVAISGPWANPNST